MTQHSDQQLTSVKVNTRLYEDFQILTVKTKLTFTKLADRAMFLYVTDPTFRTLINNQINTYYTGSQL